ncbi:MAG: hypothetical protein KHY19_13345 [Coprobacillus cateniformis]|nr:hypothetical protein [Coprobacillus cateniformis]DAK98763.1 MAG TPA: hypothetical protein [Caudoviricetes sp.]
MFSFYFAGIQYGWLFLKVQVGHKYMVVSCDESLGDPLPGMIRMYNSLKKGEDSSFSMEGIDFIIKFIENKEKVKFCIKIDSPPHGWVTDETISQAEYDKMADEGLFIEDETVLEGEKEIAVEWLLDEFEIFFEMLTSSKLYPNHYPCYGMLNDKEYDDVRTLCDKYYQKHKEEYAEKYFEMYEKLKISEKVHLTEEGYEFYKKFNAMMTTYKVPDAWK